MFQNVNVANKRERNEHTSSVLAAAAVMIMKANVDDPIHYVLSLLSGIQVQI
jgi:hypothetical protein